MTRHVHLTLAELIEHLETRVIPAKARHHLAACEDCRDSLVEIETFLADLATMPLELPDDALIRRTAALAPPRRRRQPEVRAERARAPRSKALALQPGTRGAGARQVFAGNGLYVQLEVVRRGDRLRVLGQALARVAARAPCLARAEAGGSVLAESPVDRHGMFRLEDLPLGRFEVVVESAGSRFHIGPLDEPQP